MFTKDFFKKVYNRYTCIGLCAMGIYNICLLFMYFKHWIESMPADRILFVTDAALVLGFTLLGLVVETVRMAVNKKNRGAGNTDKRNQ